jgi:hypothetical protein
MKRILIALVLFPLAGCLQTLGETFNDAMYQVGGYGNEAPTLAGTPMPTSGCSDTRCSSLDAVATKGYELARQKRITWVRFVETFYKKRAELYTSTDDRYGARELMLYQRALAEQMDAGRISESQWAYAIERKNAEISARNSASAPQPTSCTTKNVGTKTFPEYKTTCN